jgi:hypothetical protein
VSGTGYWQISFDNDAVRTLLCDAAEALWVLLAAPLKRLITEAVAEALARDGPGLRWEQAPQECPELDTDCSLLTPPPPRWLLDVYAELARSESRDTQ